MASIGFEQVNLVAYNEINPEPADNPQMNGNGHRYPAPLAFDNQQMELQPVDNQKANNGISGSGDGPSDDVAIQMDSQNLIDEKVETPSIPEGSPKSAKKKASLFMRDGVRPIDYVLAYTEDEKNEEKNRKRDTFEENLKREGIQLEHVMSKKGESLDKKTNFVKLHAPWKTLVRFAEILKFKMPIQENDMEMETRSLWETCCSCMPSFFTLDKTIVPDETAYFTAAFSQERYDQYIVTDESSFFTPSQRSRIVHWIMTKTRYENENENEKPKFGIRRLLNNGVYTGAFPLHEGPFSSQHSIYTNGAENERHLLYEVWAKPRNWYKEQPLDLIRKYYGEKVGIYFTWLGFYTMLLIPAALVGLVAFLYGLATVNSDIPNQEICSKDKAGGYVMCPLCDKICSFYNLSTSCSYSYATYLFDNEATVAFAAFMVLWATFFHEYWKRKEAFLKYDWDVAQFEEQEEQVRPEFEASVKKTRRNPINDEDEPFLPIPSRLCRYFTAFTVIIFMLCLVIAAVSGVVVYRITVVGLFYAVDDTLIQSRAKLLTTVTAALINLVIIVILNQLYTHIARFLTNIEQHRTETEWEDSFTLKMFLFQFVNFYGSIFYIAFFKGRFTGRPGKYDYSIGGSRQEECDPAGCLIELCIQLAIIMVGKQTINNFKEIILPKIKVWFKSRRIKKVEDKNVGQEVPQWEADYCLVDMPKFGLFEEYLEMVVQFGFVTIFVAAFPLAPLFALLNNIIEIRLDAYKFVTQWRRPLALRAEDIGIWFTILRSVTALAVLTNAFIIAFTSDFIPKIYYKVLYSPDGTLAGYVNFSLSNFDVVDFENRSIPDSGFGNIKSCRFRGFYDPPTSDRNYVYSKDYWYIFTIRLAFVIIFQNIVVLLTLIVAYLVPDTPYSVKMQMLREKHLSDQAIIQSIKKKT